MAAKNRDIADILETIADLLEIDEANAFRVRAYRNAARTISSLSEELAEMAERGDDLSELPDIGGSMAEKIETIVETGSLPQLEKLEKKVPPELRDLLQLENLGPKKAGGLYRELGIKTVDELEEAAREQKVRDIPGFGEKTERSLLEEIGRHKEERAGETRYLWSTAEDIVSSLLGYLGEVGGVGRVEAAGSYRRRKETVGDLDILVICDDREGVMQAFTEFEDVQRVLSRGATRSAVALRSGMHVDLRAVEEESYGAALLYFTGSKAHSVALRKMGQERDLKINEYGVFKDERSVAGRTEEEIYGKLDLPLIPPELRENRGEIEAARGDGLPDLVELDDIRGDLQSHTDATDGKYSLEDMAAAAREKGYDYLAVTDHSKRVTMAKGLDEKRLAGQMEKIDELNEGFDGFRILKSVEVDILKDGSLDLSDDILKELDLVIASVHYDTKLPAEKQTERIIRGLDNPYVNILAHPTGRIIGQRRAYEMDVRRIAGAAKERRCYLEINAQPERLDLSDVYAKMARDMDLKLAISTDAHATSELEFMRYGVGQARRGWLERKDVLNTRTWKQLAKLLKRS